MITLATLDMAGTTIDDRGAVYTALRRAVEECGVEVASEDLQTWMGTEKRAAIEALIRLGGADPHATAGLIDGTFDRFRAIVRDLYAENPPVAIAGVPAAIAQMRSRGIRVVLTTGFSRDVAEQILDTLNWAVADGSETTEATQCVVDGLVCGDEVPAGRPAPFLIFRAMEMTGTLAVDQVIAVGDTVVDVQAGLNAGVAAAIGVLTGSLTHQAFEEHSCPVVLPSVADLPQFLDLQHRPRPAVFA